MKDKYPAYVNWETFEKIQSMLRDNYAEYDRNKTRGIPREGEALLHGIVYCGECGHKMVVQYKNGTRYLCNYLRQQHGTPVCQYIPANPIDQQAVTAFFQALAPAELNVLVRASTRRRQADVATERAQAQQVERLRYRAALAERQFEQVDPDNRWSLRNSSTAGKKRSAICGRLKPLSPRSRNARRWDPPLSPKSCAQPSSISDSNCPSCGTVHSWARPARRRCCDV